MEETVKKVVTDYSTAHETPCELESKLRSDYEQVLKSREKEKRKLLGVILNDIKYAEIKNRDNQIKQIDFRKRLEILKTIKVKLNDKQIMKLIQKRVNFIVEEREKIYDEFTEFAYPSRTNFLLMDLDAGDYLGKKGVGVRTFSGELSNMIRVTIGTYGENERFVECLEDYVEQFEPSTKKQINSGDKR